MKSLVFVLVPYSVAPSAIREVADELIGLHQMVEGNRAMGRFDYLVGTDGSFHDPVAEGYLPTQLKRGLHRQLCTMDRLPATLVPNALVTPDGMWHDRDDYEWRVTNRDGQASAEAGIGWEEYYPQLLEQNPLCWVVQYVAHS